MSQEAPHALLKEKEINRIRDWNEWKELWNSTTLYEFKMGLISTGFKTCTNNQDEKIERLCLYMDFADRADSSTAFTSPGQRHNSVGELHQSLAKRARQNLVTYCFNDDAKDHWTQHKYSIPLIEKMLWFFRSPKDGNHGNMFPWTTSDAENNTIIKAAKDFCEKIWNLEVQHDPELQMVCRNARTQIVGLLDYLRQLNLLLDPKRFPPDFRTMRELHRLAMTQKIWRYDDGPTVGDKPPATLEEAIAASNRAAQVYLILYATLKERRRVRKQKPAEEKLKQAQREFERLTKK